MTFHLLTVFPNNVAEQESYYITNALKKPQCISICQFVQRVEQLNSYILQLPCWYYSPSAKTNTVPMNVPFAEADLSRHVLRMCPYVWQDQYNLHKKGGTPVDMRSLLLSLEAIKRVCGQERSKKSNASCNKKALHSEKKGTKQPGTEATARVPKKACNEKHCNSARSMGARTRRTILVIAVGLRKMERKNLISAQLRKAERNPIPRSSLSRS